jgi:hypothetical protein
VRTTPGLHGPQQGEREEPVGQYPRPLAERAVAEAGDEEPITLTKKTPEKTHKGSAHAGRTIRNWIQQLSASRMDCWGALGNASGPIHHSLGAVRVGTIGQGSLVRCGGTL